MTSQKILVLEVVSENAKALMGSSLSMSAAEDQELLSLIHFSAKKV